MSRFRRLLATSATAALMLTALAVSVSSAGAGEVMAADAPLTILKTVSGPVPAGTTFTVTVTCDGNIDGPDANEATVTFDSAGTPTSDNVITFGDPGACTVTETANGGARTTSYACTGENPEDEVVVPAPTAGSSDISATGVEPVDPCTSVTATDVTVAIIDSDQTATVTVTNTFVAPPAPEPAAAVVVTPVVTG